MKVGLQLYTVRKGMAKNPVKTLEMVAEEGYQYIEMANHNADTDIGTGFGMTKEEFIHTLSSLGLHVVGAHIAPSGQPATLPGFYQPENDDQWKRIIDFYAGTGAQYLSIPLDFFTDMDYLKRRCEAYNRIGSYCRLSGLQLLYHNHYSEYQRLEGKYLMDLILENTDSDNLGIELDAYWVFRGLIDPAKLIRHYGNRVKLLHEKDFPLDQVNNLCSWNFVDQNILCTWESFHSATREEFFTEIGEGVIKIQDVIDAGNEVGIPYIFIEQDASLLDERASIKKSMENFKKMRGMEWED